MNQCLHELLTKPRTCEGIRRLNAWEPHEQSEFIELLYKHFRKCLHYDGSHGVMQEQGRQNAGEWEGIGVVCVRSNNLAFMITHVRW